jgi:NAD(P)H-dependent flavin oxidoreductase YrpB (nitropropane dioxygenase family)
MTATTITTSIPMLPTIIQGGMGIGVSNWRLARAVASRGHLGVVSGTAVDMSFVRRLQDGDPGGDLRRAIAAFPIPGVGAEALRRWFRPEGREPGTPYVLASMYRHTMSKARQQLTMLANFCEVWLAKEGHDGPVGINLLTKVQFPTLASLYGAMLAGVDCVLMGAGMPREIPGALDALAAHRTAQLRSDADFENAPPLVFDPAAHDAPLHLVPKRPAFLAIIASNSLATMLARKANGRVDGFVIEGPTAGGHNAPPRGGGERNARGEPVYGPRDAVDLARIAELGLPFWLAGGTGSPEALRSALDAGAAGIQVGTLFAYADESGLDAALKREVLEGVLAGEVTVRTDAEASPTGYPFKLVERGGVPVGAVERKRKCDIGGLRTMHRHEGRTVYRCPAEPVEDYVKKGGRIEDTVGRRCLCNGLMSDIGLPQVTESGELEPALLTAGDDLPAIGRFLQGRAAYGVDDVLAYLTGDPAVGDAAGGRETEACAG